jgi:hypothetical protein
MKINNFAVTPLRNILSRKIQSPAAYAVLFDESNKKNQLLNMLAVQYYYSEKKKFNRFNIIQLNAVIWKRKKNIRKPAE